MAVKTVGLDGLGYPCEIYKHPRKKYSVGREYEGAGEKLPSGAKYDIDQSLKKLVLILIF